LPFHDFSILSFHAYIETIFYISRESHHHYFHDSRFWIAYRITHKTRMDKDWNFLDLRTYKNPWKLELPHSISLSMYRVTSDYWDSFPRDEYHDTRMRILGKRAFFHYYTPRHTWCYAWELARILDRKNYRKRYSR
jgi:hypothetical protein